MKIVFSRKGFDSSAGGVPSPVIGGRPRSLPIPTGMPSGLMFSDLAAPLPAFLASVAPELRQLRTCHLDPDIDRSAIGGRPEGWRGALGQIGSAQSHLVNQNVGPGDVFVFWGLFAEAAEIDGSWRYAGRQHHRIFGWLEVADIIVAGEDGSHALSAAPWLRDHPHARDGWGSAANTIYVGAERSAFVDGLPGYGTFKAGMVLSASPNDPKSVWRVPDWLHPATGGTGMSFHPDNRWLDGGLVKSVGRGQEFVADIAERADARAWLADLLGDAA